jgi:threonine synthase
MEPDERRHESTVHLGEGRTPLVLLRRWGTRHGLGDVYAKLEFAGPTGSFKDRGAATLVSAAASAGATRLVEDSSGNAGAAVAAYAAHAGLACTIFAPASAPAQKLRQIAAYGAELVRVEGPREAVTAAAARAAREDPGAYYASHNTNPLFVDGCKAFAHELARRSRADHRSTS